MAHSILLVIPARYASTRLPGKPLVKIAGKEMIRRVAEIAEKSGFSSSGSFISNFRREYGCTPLQYRELRWNSR